MLEKQRSGVAYRNALPIATKSHLDGMIEVARTIGSFRLDVGKLPTFSFDKEDQWNQWGVETLKLQLTSLNMEFWINFKHNNWLPYGKSRPDLAFMKEGTNTKELKSFGRCK